jgi:hypothetical protein
MKRRQPKDGLLRSESSAALSVSIARRDAVIEALEKRLSFIPDIFPKGSFCVEVSGPSSFRVSAKDDSLPRTANLMLEGLPAVILQPGDQYLPPIAPATKYTTERHITKCRNSEFPHTLIVVVR